jgi:hypothetical protein
MRAVMILLASMGLHQPVRLGQTTERLDVEQFVPKPAVGRLDIGILSGAGRGYVPRHCLALLGRRPAALDHSFVFDR